MTATPISVLLVDDHRRFREALHQRLSSEPDLVIVAEAGDGHEAVRLARTHVPDIVIMDICMPGLDGIGATRQILSMCPGTRVVAMSVYAGRQFTEPMVRAGAYAFITKDNVTEELVPAIRQAAATRRE